MMAQFWIGAGLLSAAALAFVMVPLWRQRQLSGGWSRMGSLVAALLVPAAVGLYLGIGTWNGQSAPDTAAALPPMTELVESLDARLQAQPDDPAGWYLLGQSYMTLSRYVDARRAFREGLARDPAPGIDMKLSFAEAQTLTDPQALLGEAGQIFEEALEVEPDNPTALWYGGLAAAATERTGVARQRWSRLLQLDPPQAMRDVLQEHLNALGGISEPVQEPPLQLAQTDPSGGLAIRLHIRLGDELAASNTAISPGSALFIFARAPEGGPPVAVIRETASAVPGEFSLSDANNMLPGRSLADFEALTIVARISSSGQPTETPGDVYGEVLYMPEVGSGIVELVIDQIAQ
ncbi:MAG: tetratricopeptide repeat protein [Proteobacteria bacterium]|nr:tetratricopeptide repeat protein [Pseudomonadota bacterium]MYJ96533.1 tetratricopeptide repeat protein [Pseudomonadota bacterium]